MNAIIEFTARLKFVKREDIIQIFPMAISFGCSLFYKIFHKNIWLVCERKGDARDNGYWFYKYLCENHPEIEAVYAIDKKSVDYPKVAALGRVIQFGSFKHWLYYWAARRNVSSQKEGKPNAALCFILEVYLGMRKNRAYIRHGISKDDQKWVYYAVTKMNMFATAAKREYDFVCERFGYPEGYVQLTGLCRFDNLKRPHEIKRQILVMPTMREWLRVISSDTMKYEGTMVFTESEYYKTWTSLLGSDRLHKMLEAYDMDLLFFPHASMQHYIDQFKSGSKHIIIANAKEYDVQQLLMESSVLITDYSSVYMDFAYMEKPLLYYHFDYEKYRRGQYQEGYYSYENDGFGKVVAKEDVLLNELNLLLSGGMKMPDIYKDRVKEFFAFHDDNNCERTFEAIKMIK